LLAFLACKLLVLAGLSLARSLYGSDN
jgi:hypothetical protein